MSRPLDQTIALVTGATDGLGRGVASQLAARGAAVIVHGRGPERARATADAIHAATGSERVRPVLADLSELAQVRGLADEILEREPELNLLINNAGIGSGLPDSREREESRDGYELRFAVNYLAGFALTERLLPRMRRNAPARIVNVSSLGQAPIDFDDPMLTHRYSGSQAYYQSKLAQVMYTIDLSDRLSADEVTANALHPSTYMPTKIVLEERGQYADSLESGIEATMRLAVDSELDGVSGKFFDRTRESRVEAQAYDRDARARLRELSERLVAT